MSALSEALSQVFRQLLGLSAKPPYAASSKPQPQQESALKLSPREAQFVETMQKKVNDWFVETRGIPVSAEQYREMLPEVARHISQHTDMLEWWGDCYVWGKCNRMGILQNGMPAQPGRYIGAESIRMQELRELGGDEAVKAYRSIYPE